MTVIVEFLKIFSVNVDPGKGGSVLFKIGEDGKYNTYSRTILCTEGETVYLKAVPDSKHTSAHGAAA